MLRTNRCTYFLFQPARAQTTVILDEAKMKCSLVFDDLLIQLEEVGFDGVLAAAHGVTVHRLTLNMAQPKSSQWLPLR